MRWLAISQHVGAEPTRAANNHKLTARNVRYLLYRESVAEAAAYSDAGTP
jgi:hypothetical protein